MFDFAQRYEGITGSAIRNIFSLLAVPGMISFAGGNPSPKSFPSEKLSEIAQNLIENYGNRVLQYGGTAGTDELLGVMRQMFQNMGIDMEGQDVVILTGSSQGIELISKVMINKGDTILVESPTFLGALQTFHLYEANVESVAMEDDGIDVEMLEQQIQKYHPKFLYTIPTFQNPSGRTMSEEKRKKVVEICGKYGVLVLEDDPYADLRFEGEPLKPLKYYDKTSCVLKLFSFSKIISPGLRVGAAVGPKEVIGKMVLGKQGADVHTANLTQDMVAEYVKQGCLEEHIADICQMYRQQRDKMMECIAQYFPKEIKVVKPQGGLFIWAELPEHMNATELFHQAVENKVAYVPGTHFYDEGGHHNTLRLNFSMASMEEIDKGIYTLGNMFAQHMY